jgi:LysM repeat protein
VSDGDFPDPPAGRTERHDAGRRAGRVRWNRNPGASCISGGCRKYVEEKDRDPEELQSLPGITCYFVKPGDTLWDIAKKFYTTTEKIRELNDLKTENLTPMQQLLVERV